MTSFDYQPRTRVIFAAGSARGLGTVARELGFRRALLIADPGLVEAGHVARASHSLEHAGITVIPYHRFGPNPTTGMIQAARAFSIDARFDSIVALGGGSSLDVAKAVNIICHNPGFIEQYQGYAKGAGALAPMIALPTTAGTGSEAQTYAILSHPTTHLKMAIGDPQAAFRLAILDPELTLSQPPEITATAGYDAISHAVEAFVTTRRNAMSDCFAREAWRLLSGAFERVLAAPADIDARGDMLMGAHLAGAAIENSMLGATHACANPLTARFGIPHGAAIAVMLPHVVRWNQITVAQRYGELFLGDLGLRLAELGRCAGLPSRLSELNVPKKNLPDLAADAAQQWTGRFNPRPFDAAAALELYQCAY